jgi:hypothetical protein
MRPLARKGGSTMRTFWLVVGLVALSVVGAEAAPARREARCCIQVPADEGVGTRPFCFNIAAKTMRRSKRLCRAIGGEPQQPAQQRVAIR